MLTLKACRADQIHETRAPWHKHFDIDYHLTAIPVLVTNPGEVLTAIWGLCITHAPDWLARGWTEIVLVDRFRDRILWHDRTLNLANRHLLPQNGIEWLANSILRQNPKT